MLQYQERLLVEEAQVSERLNDLGGFIHSGAFEILAPEDQADLQEQYNAMRLYVKILRRQIGRFAPALANEQG